MDYLPIIPPRPTAKGGIGGEAVLDSPFVNVFAPQFSLLPSFLSLGGFSPPLFFFPTFFSLLLQLTGSFSFLSFCDLSDDS